MRLEPRVRADLAAGRLAQLVPRDRLEPLVRLESLVRPDQPESELPDRPGLPGPLVRLEPDQRDRPESQDQPGRLDPQDRPDQPALRVRMARRDRPGLLEQPDRLAVRLVSPDRLVRPDRLELQGQQERLVPPDRQAQRVRPGRDQAQRQVRGEGTAHLLTWTPTTIAGSAVNGPVTVAANTTYTGGTINCSTVSTNGTCVYLNSGSTINGVVITGGNGASSTAVGFYPASGNASNATMENCYVHDVPGEGAGILPGPNGPGVANDSVIDNRFYNTGAEAFHAYGVASAGRPGWTPSAGRSTNLQLIGNVSVNAWTSLSSPSGNSGSFVVQSGWVDSIIEYNAADSWFSLVDLSGSLALGTSSGSPTGGYTLIEGNYENASGLAHSQWGSPTWGMEIGGNYYAIVQNNQFDTSNVGQAIVCTGSSPSDENANNQYGPDIFTNGANTNVVQGYNGGGNVYNSPDVCSGQC